jgi:hypothetical protein
VKLLRVLTGVTFGAGVTMAVQACCDRETFFIEEGTYVRDKVYGTDEEFGADTVLEVGHDEVVLEYTSLSTGDAVQIIFEVVERLPPDR